MTAKRALLVRHLKRQEYTLRIDRRWTQLTIPRRFRIFTHVSFVGARRLAGPQSPTRGKRGFW